VRLAVAMIEFANRHQRLNRRFAKNEFAKSDENHKTENRPYGRGPRIGASGLALMKVALGSWMSECVGMRKGIEVRLGPDDRERLETVVGSGNSPQKHVWRARIVLLSAEGIGTMAIQRQTGKGKPTIWRWQARFMAEGVDGLLHDATRPGRKKPLPPIGTRSSSAFSTRSTAKPQPAGTCT
jgi:Winged helix-turn helix